MTTTATFTTSTTVQGFSRNLPARLCSGGCGATVTDYVAERVTTRRNGLEWATLYAHYGACCIPSSLRRYA